MTAVARKALVLAHDEGASTGLLGDWLNRRAIETTMLVVSSGVALPDPVGFDLMVLLGSARCAADDALPWVPREADYLTSAHADGVPILGICFGAQLLARALGGTVRPGAVAAIGWTEVTSEDAAICDGPWFEWHFDSIVPPPGAQILATSSAGVEAFAIGRSLGVQFHPEATAAIIQDWRLAYGAELSAHAIDPADLRDVIAEHGAAARIATLLDAFAHRVGLALEPEDRGSLSSVAPLGLGATPGVAFT